MEVFKEAKKLTELDENLKQFEIPFNMIYVRHGQSGFKPEMAKLGNINLPLTPLGIEQSKQSAKDIRRIISIHKLQNVVGGLEELRNIQLIASPLLRTKETCEIIKKELGIKKDIIFMESIQEFNFGEFIEGKGLVNMEKRDHFRSRVTNAVVEIQKMMREQDYFFPVIVAHGKVWKYMWNTKRKLSFAECCFLEKKTQKINYGHEEKNDYDYSHSNIENKQKQ